MEPQAKRPRTGPSPLGQRSKEDEDDELNYEPHEVSQMRDPGYQLEQSRAFAAFKLKSTFEHIFQKYERDFTGIGDEIDLRTGEIVTDNGHLARMRNERDTGIPDQDDEEDEGRLLEDAFASGDDDEEEDGEDGEDENEERISNEKGPTPPSTPPTKKALPTSGSESEKRLSNLGPPHQSANGNSSSSANPWGREPESADPTWRVPEINPPKSDDDLIAKLYGARYRFPVSSGSQSVWASRQDSEQEKAAPEPARIDMAQLARARKEASRMARPTSKKILHVFTTDDDEEDILGVSTADQELGIEKKKGKKKTRQDAAKGQTQTETSLPDSSVKESARHKSGKSSAGGNLTSKKQLVPAKVRKPRKSAQLAGSSDQGGEEHLVGATTRLGSTQGLNGVSAGKEVQKRPGQHIVIELFSKRPPAHEITEAKDPEDMDIFDSAPQDTVDSLKLGGLTVSEPLSNSPVLRDALVEAIPDATAAVKAISGQTSAPLKEKFTRHEIDPSYAFSDDDDDGIPVTQARAGRSQKEPTAVPITEESTKLARVTDIQPGDSEQMLLSEISGSRQDSETQPEAGAENANSSSTAEESADAGLHHHEASQTATNVQSASISISQTSRDIPDEHQTTEQHVTNDINMAGAEHAQSTEDIDMQILELLDEIYQETESYGGAVEGAREGRQLEEIREEVRPGDVPVSNFREEIRTEVIQEGDETEEERPAGDILQEGDEEVIEPFIIPLGLDEIDETSTAETDPGPEQMSFELLVLPPLAQAAPPTGALSAMPRRGRPSSAIHSGRLENSATSPMRGLILRSSSPLERHADPGSTLADARASVSPKYETTPQMQEAAASWYPPAIASQATLPEAAAPLEFSAVGQASPAPTPPRRKRQQKQPSTPSSRRPRIAAKGSSARISVISLLSDDDEDEKLTPEHFKTRTPGGGDGPSGDAGGGLSSTPALPAWPQAKTATPVLQQQHVPSGGRADSGASTTARHRKRMAAWAFATPSKVRPGSQSGTPVRTPGGSLRRCGEEGFRCDRDFCFTCL